MVRSKYNSKNKILTDVKARPSLSAFPEVPDCLLRGHLLLGRCPSTGPHQDTLPEYKSSYSGHDGRTAGENVVPQYGGIRNALKAIYKDEGLRGLYKGFYISLLCQASSMAFFFWM